MNFNNSLVPIFGFIIPVIFHSTTNKQIFRNFWNFFTKTFSRKVIKNYQIIYIFFMNYVRTIQVIYFFLHDFVHCDPKFMLLVDRVQDPYTQGRTSKEFGPLKLKKKVKLNNYLIILIIKYKIFRTSVSLILQ
jgi:hypothetical protein